MPPTIHCVRHAQGYHNLSIANHNMHDPLLTPVGEQQCRDLKRDFPYHDKIDCIVASPLKRTIYTALLGFSGDLESKGLKVVAIPELQETSDLPCDTGSPASELLKEFTNKPLDLQLVSEGWDNKKGRWAANSDAIIARARDARKWLMARPEENIVLVTHGGFLHYFTEDWAGSDRFAGTGWANTEFRSYTFSTTDRENAHLIETADSRRRRLPDLQPLDHNETANLTRTISQDAAEKARQDAASASAIQAKV